MTPFLALMLASGVAGPGQATFDPLADPDFGDPRPAIARYLSAPWRKLSGRKPTGAQSFCAVGYDYGNARSVLLHWGEGRRILVWEGRGIAGYPDDTLRHGRYDLSLDTDVVATEDDVAGSTYLVTRAWADGVIADCAARGRRYRVRAGPARP